MWKSDKRLYLTEDRSRAVEEGDPAAAFLLVAENGELQDEEAARLGLTGKKMQEPEPVVVHSIAADPPKDEPKEDVPAEDDEPETKAVSGPPENKARSASSRKADEDK